MKYANSLFVRLHCDTLNPQIGGTIIVVRESDPNQLGFRCDSHNYRGEFGRDIPVFASAISGLVSSGKWVKLVRKNG